MPELKIKIPEELEEEIKELSEDESKFVLKAVTEKLSELRLERSRAFRRLLFSVFNRMTKDSKLSDKDCMKLGREVNEAVAKKYGL